MTGIAGSQVLRPTSLYTGQQSASTADGDVVALSSRYDRSDSRRAIVHDGKRRSMRKLGRPILTR